MQTEVYRIPTGYMYTNKNLKFRSPMTDSNGYGAYIVHPDGDVGYSYSWYVTDFCGRSSPYLGDIDIDDFACYIESDGNIYDNYLDLSNVADSYGIQ